MRACSFKPEINPRSKGLMSAADDGSFSQVGSGVWPHVHVHAHDMCMYMRMHMRMRILSHVQLYAWWMLPL